jgi:hypothetical protein
MSAKTVHDALIALFVADSACNAEFGAEIKKGFGKHVTNWAEVGRFLRIAFDGEVDVEQKIGKQAAGAPLGGQQVQKIRVAYAFWITVGFIEPDVEEAEDRKTTYPKLIKDVIDVNMTISGTCIGITDMGELNFMEIPDSNGYYVGIMGVQCTRDEIRGQR